MAAVDRFAMTTTPITYGKIRTIGLSIPIHCKWHFDSRCERSSCLRTMLYSAKRSAHQIVSEAKNTARSSSPRTSTVSPVPSGLKSYALEQFPTDQYALRGSEICRHGPQNFTTLEGKKQQPTFRSKKIMKKMRN